MKAEILTEAFKESLNKVVKVAQKHLSLPILACLLIRAEKEYVYISATNLELGIEVKVPAKITQEGVVAVSADTVWNLVSQIQSVPKIEISTNENGNIVIQAGSTTGTINIVSHEDFPSIPTVSDPVGGFTIKPQEFSSLIKSVLYSASQSSIKPELSSMFFYIDENGMLVGVTTDLFRLAEKKVALKKVNSFEKMLISIKNLVEISRILQDGRTDIDVVVKDSQVAFIAEDIYIVSRTVDSSFPDYKQIIPKEYKTEVIVLKQDLIQALKILRVFTDKLQHLKFSIIPKTNLFEVFMKNSDIGESTSKIAAKIEGESLHISFNFKYISDVLNSIPEDSIRLEFNGVGKSVVIRGVGNHSFLYLVMPLVTKNEQS